MTSAYEKKAEPSLADRMAATDRELTIEEIVYGPVDPPANPWPTLNPDALHGFAGEVVAALDPTTEADPAAVLFVLLAWAGCYLGADAHILAGNTNHPARIWPLLVGASSTGAKGTAVAAVNQFTRVVDQEFGITNTASGLSSGEGLINRVRNQRGTDPNDKNFDEGVTDKRLFVNEPEFASVLARSRREGSTLSMVIRNAFDGYPLQTITSGNPLYSTGHHITIVGAITPSELVQRMSGVDIANGFANRFMLVCSKRSKLLPLGGEPSRNDMARLSGVFSRRAQKVRGGVPVRQMEMTQAAKDLWTDQYMARHAVEMLDGPAASLRGRWHAHSIRLAVSYALLDGATQVDKAHIQAGLAAWDYSEASTQHIFGDEDADPDLSRLAEHVDNADIGGLSRKHINKVVFNGHKGAKELNVLCAKLLALGRYRSIEVPAEGGRGGRPTTFYFRIGGTSGS